MIAALLVCLNRVEWYLQVLGYVCCVTFTFGSIICLIIKRQAWARSLFVFNVLTFIIIGALAVLHWCGLFDDLSDLNSIKDLILQTGGWAYVVFIVLKLLDVIVLPLPGFLIILAGIAIFGPWQTFFLTYTTAVVGSVICFYLGRIFGQKAVVWCIGKEATEKYLRQLGNKGNLLFLIMQVLPFFPDDILCIVAGLTSMRFSFFIFTMLIAKPLYIATVCFLGTGSIIPFSGWGIPVWVTIFIVLGILFLLFCKYQTQIENWFAKITHRQKKDKTPASNQTTVPGTPA